MSTRPENNWWTLVAVCGATFMLLVDITIVQVALPRIHHDLHAGFTSLQWVLDAYALSLASLLLTAGTLADRFGRKRVFMAGVGIFTLASLLCGIAGSGLELDLARAFQGIGGAAMFTTALALIAQDFAGPARGTAIAFWGATVGGAVAVGPVLGGALTDGLGWRWIFFVNLPIGAAVLAICAVRVANIVDPANAAPRSRGPRHVLRLAAPARACAASRERQGLVEHAHPRSVRGRRGAARRIRRGRACASSGRCSTSRSFATAPFCGVSIATFAIGAGMFAAFPYLTLYLQNLLGYSPLQGGVRLLPATVFVFLVPIAARRFASRLSAGLLLGTGMALVAAGLAVMSRVSDQSRWTVLLPGLILVGIGIGLANPAIAHIALAVVAPNRSGMASGISNTFRIGGVATGVAALGAVLQHSVRNNAVIASGPRAAGAGFRRRSPRVRLRRRTISCSSAPRPPLSARLRRLR